MDNSFSVVKRRYFNDFNMGVNQALATVRCVFGDRLRKVSFLYSINQCDAYNFVYESTCNLTSEEKEALETWFISQEAII